MEAIPSVPDLTREEALWAAGTRWVAGLDEAGRGALAGPVVAGAVVLYPHCSLTGVWAEVRDSKLLAASDRERLERLVRADAAAWAIGVIPARDVDRLGIAEATRLAMATALDALSVQTQHLLIDWVRLPAVDIPQTSWAKADRGCVSVAAASILAKVGRDRILVEMDEHFPAYGFARHKGYGTLQHRNALAQHGPCPLHRYTFAPVAQHRTLFDVAADAEASHAVEGQGGAP